MNVYLTGDTHGRFERIACFCRDNHTTRGDVLIILGDAGINYYLDHRDEKLKRYIDTMPVTLLCIHGNHEARPTAALGYLNENRREYNLEPTNNLYLPGGRRVRGYFGIEVLQRVS